MYNMQCTIQAIFNMCIRSLIIDGLIFILLIYFVVFTGKSGKTFGKTHRKNHFHYLRVRSASLTNVILVPRAWRTRSGNSRLSAHSDWLITAN